MEMNKDYKTQLQRAKDLSWYYKKDFYLVVKRDNENEYSVVTQQGLHYPDFKGWDIVQKISYISKRIIK